MQFESGELVKIEDDEERVSKLQEGYGGWHPEMKKAKQLRNIFHKGEMGFSSLVIADHNFCGII